MQNIPMKFVGTTIGTTPTVEHDPDDDWARVELWRWQYGELPKQGDPRKLDVPTAVKAMSAALLDGDRDNMPTPFNAAMVLKYCSRLLSRS